MISKCANPQCSASFLRLSEGKLFQFEARQIFTLQEPSCQKGHQVAHYWLCRKCLVFMTLGLIDGTVEVRRLRGMHGEATASRRDTPATPGSPTP
jgi:hypothetical protein